MTGTLPNHFSSCLPVTHTHTHAHTQSAEMDGEHTHNVWKWMEDTHTVRKWMEDTRIQCKNGWRTHTHTHTHNSRGICFSDNHEIRKRSNVMDFEVEIGTLIESLM